MYYYLYATEPVHNSVKYLTWHRTTSLRSSSSRTPLESHSREDVEDLTNDLFEDFYRISGSHASTLDRLFAWERKLYDEVKVLIIPRVVPAGAFSYLLPINMSLSVHFRIAFLLSLYLYYAISR